ncbi:hypothetical protein PsYK624_065620 [Phanerochaete sordida]|uniref:Malate dehydrogenase n=1 Tax=Phanerochaete sordida TaxID=48140 RepID=A0A9P3LDB9_9APHY|nr:hypothetical protein PsYK624_065620 [Phanerochaete sordida]
MWFLLKLTTTLALLTFAFAFPAPEARSLNSRSGAMCSTAQISLADVMPAGINSKGGLPLSKPVAANPTWVGISVGIQNYSCTPAGVWTTVGAGAMTEIFDISCIPLSAHGAFTTFVSKLWQAAPPEMTTQELITLTGVLSLPGALGQHYFVSDPNNASSPALFAAWDFRSARLKNDKNAANAYVVGNRIGEVPSPDDPVHDADWLSLNPVLVNGKPAGQLADQVFRIHTNDGNPPASCKPGSPELSVKSVNNFWFYGGAWKDTIG